MKLSSRLTEKIAFAFCWGMGIITVSILIFIVGYTIFRGFAFIDLEFLFTPPLGGFGGEGGISSTIVVTLWLVLVTTLAVVPLGLGAGIYLAEYAPENRFTELIRRSIEFLAGVPSIIFGAFGLILFVYILMGKKSILAGGLTLAFLILPFLVRSVEEAIRAVPRTYREAALSLGATKWQMLYRILLPAARPGILTGLILCIGIALAESAPLWLTMGGNIEMPTSPLDPGRPLAVHVFLLALEARAMDAAFATGAVLLVLILSLNFLARWLSQRIITMRE